MELRGKVSDDEETFSKRGFQAQRQRIFDAIKRGVRIPESPERARRITIADQRWIMSSQRLGRVARGGRTNRGDVFMMLERLAEPTQFQDGRADTPVRDERAERVFQCLSELHELGGDRFGRRELRTEIVEEQQEP